MHEIRATAQIAAPTDQVFAFVSDHERFLTGGGMTCTLANPGTSDRNGVGAVRVVRSGGLMLREEVLSFEPDHRYEYVIRAIQGPLGIAVPVRHELGWVELTPNGDRTDVVWASRFEVQLPFGRDTVARLAGNQLETAFGRLLERAARKIAA
ncbi:MAG: SRPBCC family protein [Myxococcota bacterium]